MKVCVLMLDADGTLHSQPKPIGYAVTNQQIAQDWVARANPGYQRAFVVVELIDGDGNLPMGWQ